MYWEKGHRSLWLKTFTEKQISWACCNFLVYYFLLNVTRNLTSVYVTKGLKDSECHRILWDSMALILICLNSVKNKFFLHPALFCDEKNLIMQILIKQMYSSLCKLSNNLWSVKLFASCLKYSRRDQI